MKRHYMLSICIALMYGALALPASAQVSNDNEDGVYKVDERMRSNDFVPGQVLLKFKDDSSISVHRNAKGKFRAASISAVDKLLREYGVDDMEKLFPAEVAKTKSQLRRKVAPNGTVVQERNLDKVYWIKTYVQSSDSTLQLIERLKGVEEVEYAEPNYRVYITADGFTGEQNMSKRPPRDIRLAPVRTETDANVICANPSQNPLYTQQYGITQQNIHQLWDKPIINKKRPVIAILDTGVDIEHPDLKDNIWQNAKEVDGELACDDDNNGIVDDKYGWNFVEDYYDLTDYHGHGTHVAGIAAACDNSIGIVGANPMALIMPVKVIGDRGTGDIASICRGILYAAENGADVINMSFGHNGASISQTEIDAITKAFQTTVLVAAAGNYGVDVYDGIHGPLWPAAFYMVLGVQASDSSGKLAGFSNYDPDGPIFSEDGVDGRNHEIMVPGVDIYSTYPNGNYKQLSGTSMSSPLFAGAVSALQMVKEYPSKDVLFGDLIHLKADFAKIYSDETPRYPYIDVVSYIIDDNVAGNYNIDGLVDVGETIRFIPVLRNTWADVTDISFKVSVDPVYASLVEILNPEEDFGHSLSAYARMEAKNPINVKIANNIADNTRLKFVMEITCSESNQVFKQDLYITVNNLVKIEGLITENHTLTSDHVYHVTNSLGIMKGATLTIEPGTRLEIDNNIGIISFGKLVAKGTPERPIVFTGHKGAKWYGIGSHKSEDILESGGNLYTNSDSTLFTLAPTAQTPNMMSSNIYTRYLSDKLSILDKGKKFKLSDYMDLPVDAYGQAKIIDMGSCPNSLKDPYYLNLTPAVIQMLNDYKEYCRQMTIEYANSDEFFYQCEVACELVLRWEIYNNPRDTISYCIMDALHTPSYGYPTPVMNDCVLSLDRGFFIGITGVRNNLTSNYGLVLGGDSDNGYGTPKDNLFYSNIVNNPKSGNVSYKDLSYNNFFNNWADNESFYLPEPFRNTEYWLFIGNNNSPGIPEKSEKPSYLGTSREDIVRPHVYEMGNGSSDFVTSDLSNMPTSPFKEAHGIVWKVVVNGKDAQDEFEDLAPLGIGRHKFEVYFNRPMNKEVVPQISFGVREPYTQQKVDEDGGWNEEGTIYTAYKTISGKTLSDGLNRIYVQGAEDNEFFDCPYEKSRFNIIINAAGSMATGFMALPNLGRVTLQWNNEENDFDDAMGFNVYRYWEEEKLMLVKDEWGNIKYEMDDNGQLILDDEGNLVPKMELRVVVDTIRLNKETLDITTTEFIDYDVIPGQTYHYYYKVLSTGLTEYDVSNVVAATPLTATMGDANGSGNVDVADVITTVNYASGQQPKPFIFEAADMNTDQMINILDIIGIIKTIINPNATAVASVEATATYTIEDGTLYVESPVTLAGVQIQISNSQFSNINSQFEVASDLNGFEHTSAWLSDNDYIFLAYNMNGKTLNPGKHALLHIGNGQIAQMYLSDANGHNVMAIGDDATKVNRMANDVMNVPGIYDLQGRKLTGDSSLEGKLPKGVYIINGKKVIK